MHYIDHLDALLQTKVYIWHTNYLYSLIVILRLPEMWTPTSYTTITIRKRLILSSLILLIVLLSNFHVNEVIPFLCVTTFLLHLLQFLQS